MCYFLNFYYFQVREYIEYFELYLIYWIFYIMFWIYCDICTYCDILIYHRIYIYIYILSLKLCQKGFLTISLYDVSSNLRCSVPLINLKNMAKKCGKVIKPSFQVLRVSCKPSYTNCLSVFDYFVKWALKGSKVKM